MFEPELYYMAPLQNSALIRGLGIYSYNDIRKHSVLSKPEWSTYTESIADFAVNRRRHKKKIGKRGLHDYVPLYWATHTPMQYDVTIRDKRLNQDDLVFAVCDAEELLLVDDVRTTDGNAANDRTNVYPYDKALPHLDSEILKCRNPSKYEYSDEYIRKKMAEVLVPKHVDNNMIERMVTRTAAAAKQLERLSMNLAHVLEVEYQIVIDKSSLPPIEVDPELYYR